MASTPPSIKGRSKLRAKLEWLGNIKPQGGIGDSRARAEEPM
jgi:hypothetical protein